MKLLSRINRVYKEMAAKKKKPRRKTPKTPPSSPASRRRNSPTMKLLKTVRNRLPKNAKISTLKNRATNLTGVRLIGSKPVLNRIKNWEARSRRRN